MGLSPLLDLANAAVWSVACTIPEWCTTVNANPKHRVMVKYHPLQPLDHLGQHATLGLDSRVEALLGIKPLPISRPAWLTPARLAIFSHRITHPDPPHLIQATRFRQNGGGGIPEPLQYSQRTKVVAVGTVAVPLE